MSPIGRIFIVLNLILSGFFLGWASNALGTTEDFKNRYETAVADHEVALSDKEDEISKHLTEKNQHSDQARQFREERDQHKTSVDSLQTQLDEAKRNNDQMQTNLAQIQATMGDYKSMIETMTAEKDRQSQRANDAETARNDANESAQAAEMARRDAVEAMQASQAQIGELEAERNVLQSDLAALETQFQVLVEITGVDIEQIKAQPQIEAAVLDVKLTPSPGLVMLNVGADKKVQRGYTFEIYRGTQYKGKVRVENVQDQFCSAIITRTVPGATITQGDLAATRL